MIKSLLYRIGGVMINVLVSSAVYRGFEPRSGQKPKIIKLVFVASPLSTHPLRRKSKDWLARNQDNVSGYSEMSIHPLLIQ